MKLAIKFRKWIDIFMLATYVPPVLNPIGYVLFNTPTPDKWQLTLPIK